MHFRRYLHGPLHPRVWWAAVRDAGRLRGYGGVHADLQRGEHGAGQRITDVEERAGGLPLYLGLYLRRLHRL